MDHVEVIIRLHAVSTCPVTVDGIVGTSQMTATSAARVLSELEAAGIARRAQDGYYYDADTRERAAIDQLVEMYNIKPVTLIRAVYSRPNPVRYFADAFRLRKRD
jgi:hypothetical protein